MKNTIKKRAFVSAIAMLIVSAIVLTSSTFAWFSMSKEASVESMDLTVSSPEGIQISANATTWTASLKVDEIFDNNPKATSRYDAYAGNNNLYPADLFPVSSAFAAADSATGYANFYKTTLDANAKATISAVTQSKESQNDAGFIAFDLFFKVAEGVKVYFDKSTFTDTTENSGNSINTALRVAFTPLGTVSIGTDAATVQALNTFTSSKTISYEVDSVNRSDDAAELGIQPGYIETKYMQSNTGNGTIATNGIVNAGTSIKGTAIKDTDNASNKAFNLDAGITKVRVYIWVEGQDVDCLNSVSGAAFTAALKFTID